MEGILIVRSIAAAVAAVQLARLLLEPEDPFDDCGINDDFSDKIDGQIDRHHRKD